MQQQWPALGNKENNQNILNNSKLSVFIENYSVSSDIRDLRFGSTFSYAERDLIQK